MGSRYEDADMVMMEYEVGDEKDGCNSVLMRDRYDI